MIPPGCFTIEWHSIQISKMQATNLTVHPSSYSLLQSITHLRRYNAFESIIGSKITTKCIKIPYPQTWKSMKCLNMLAQLYVLGKTTSLYNENHRCLYFNAHFLHRFQPMDSWIQGAAAAPLRAKRSGMRRYTDLPSSRWRPLDGRHKAVLRSFKWSTVRHVFSLNVVFLPVLPGSTSPTKQQSPAAFKGRMEDYSFWRDHVGVSKNNGGPPNHPFVHRVFHDIFTIHFGGFSNTPIFGSTPMYG